jgi:hypothetical protein
MRPPLPGLRHGREGGIFSTGFHSPANSYANVNNYFLIITCMIIRNYF